MIETVFEGQHYKEFQGPVALTSPAKHKTTGLSEKDSPVTAFVV